MVLLSMKSLHKYWWQYAGNSYYFRPNSIT